MKKNQRLIAVIVLCIASLGISAMAANMQQMEPYFIGLNRASAQLSISSSGVASCKGTVAVKNGYSASVTWELQGNGNGIWSAVQSWQSSGTGTLMLSKDRYVMSGCDYRFKAKALVYDSRDVLVETVTATSDTIHYR